MSAESRCAAGPYQVCLLWPEMELVIWADSQEAAHRRVLTEMGPVQVREVRPAPDGVYSPGGRRSAAA